MKAYVESYKMIHVMGTRDRMAIKAFRDRTAMYEFLAKGSNSLSWRESTRGLKPGVYAYAGGQWHNVKRLDPSMLAHI